MPVDWEEDRRVPKDAEVERIVGVLPNVVTADNEVLPKCLLQSRVEFVAEARA